MYGIIGSRKQNAQKKKKDQKKTRIYKTLHINIKIE